MTRARILTIGILAFVVLCILCLALHLGAIRGKLGSATMPAMASSVQMTMLGDTVFLRGTIPDEATRTLLVDQARTAYPSQRIVENFKFAPGAASITNLPGILSMMPILARHTAESGFRLRAETLAVVGAIETEPMKRLLLDSLHAALYGMAVIDQLRIAPKQDLVDARQTIADLLSGSVVEFVSGSATLTPKGAGVLDALLPALNKVPGALIEVQGHTDARGNIETNQVLSQRRADAVRDYLVEHGIAAAHITAKGFGSTRPKVAGDSPEAWQQDRRVELALH